MRSNGWDIGKLDMLFIENVGNLVCPASYDLSEDLRVVLISVTEGEDKPLKYPTIFNSADVAVVTKMDLAAAQEERNLVSFLSIIAVGFFLGMRHATDPDHVIAVTTIVTRQRQLTRAFLTGAFWGVGHTLTILVVGAMIILFNVVIPTRIGLSMEFSVALMLIFLGAMNVAAFLRAMPSFSDQAETRSEALHSHAHAHIHGDYVHSHAHGHSPEVHSHRRDRTPLALFDRLFAKVALYRPVRPFVVGVVHGLAGSAAVALLVLTTIPNPRWAVVYLLVFGLGTVGGMMLITMSIASAFTFLGKGRQKFSQRLALVSGLLSLAFGVLLVYQIGFAGGLFTSHPHWTPR